MTLLALDHVNIRTARLAEMTRFYEEVMGLPKGPRPSPSAAAGFTVVCRLPSIWWRSEKRPNGCPARLSISPFGPRVSRNFSPGCARGTSPIAFRSSRNLICAKSTSTIRMATTSMWISLPMKRPTSATLPADKRPARPLRNSPGGRSPTVGCDLLSARRVADCLWWIAPPRRVTRAASKQYEPL